MGVNYKIFIEHMVSPVKSVAIEIAAVWVVAQYSQLCCGFHCLLILWKIHIDNVFFVCSDMHLLTSIFFPFLFRLAL